MSVPAAGVPVRAIELRDLDSFIACGAAIFGERIYFARPDPFPAGQTAQFVDANLRSGNPQWVLDDAGTIAGWCDIVRKTIPTEQHTGVLGIGVLASYRGQGHGERLIRATLGAARAVSFERVELQVFAANVNAAALYRKVGFVHEGTRSRAKKLDGVYDDIHTMGLVF